VWEVRNWGDRGRVWRGIASATTSLALLFALALPLSPSLNLSVWKEVMLVSLAVIGGSISASTGFAVTGKHKSNGSR
jgi:hypothetical protein